MGLLSEYNPADPFGVHGLTDNQIDPGGGEGGGGGGGIVVQPPAPQQAGGIGTFQQPTTPGGVGGGGGNGETFPGLGALSGTPSFKFPGVPTFSVDPFTAPTAKDVFNSPDFQTRMQTGEDALQHSAAARGVLNTGGTLKDIIDYGKKFGAGEYNDAYNHAANTYQLNYQRQHDAFAPLMAQWQTKAQATMAASLAAFQRQWDIYSFTHKGANVFAPVGYPASIPPAPTAPAY